MRLRDVSGVSANYAQVQITLRSGIVLSCVLHVAYQSNGGRGEGVTDSTFVITGRKGKVEGSAVPSGLML